VTEWSCSDGFSVARQVSGSRNDEHKYPRAVGEDYTLRGETSQHVGDAVNGFSGEGIDEGDASVLVPYLRAIGRCSTGREYGEAQSPDSCMWRKDAAMERAGDPTLAELRATLPHIAQKLREHGAQIDGLEDLAAHSIADYFILGLLYPKYSHIMPDQILEAQGPLGFGPAVAISSTHHVLGLRIVRSRSVPGLVYAVYTARTLDFTVASYVVMPKRLRLRFFLDFRRRKNQVEFELTPPVLPPEILRRILRNSLDFIGRKRDLKALGVTLARGILLDGPPGNGKSLLCGYLQSLCRQRGIKTGEIGAPQLLEAFKNGNLTQLVTSAPVLFFDDIDISFLSRKAGHDGQMACALLAAMSGVDKNTGLCVRIFTTNEDVKDLDPAFLRPGRIDLRETFPRPDSELRGQLYDRWADAIRGGVDRAALVRHTDGFSFAEMEYLKTLLAMEDLMGSGRWDLELALDEFHRSRQDMFQGPKKTGF
jgi:cell division protease FtsH